MRRREILGALGAAIAATTSVARPSSANDKEKKAAAATALTVADYLARAALLLDETKRSQDWIGYHPADIGLAALALELAELRSSSAAKLPVPATLKSAHMHLLLALENTTASFDATMRGDGKKAAQRMAAARSEELTLHQTLDALKLKIPAIK